MNPGVFAVLVGLMALVVLSMVRWQWGLAFLLGAGTTMLVTLAAVLRLTWYYGWALRLAVVSGLLLGMLSGREGSKREPLWLGLLFAAPQVGFALLALAGGAFGDGRLLWTAVISFCGTGAAAFAGDRLRLKLGW